MSKESPFTSLSTQFNSIEMQYRTAAIELTPHKQQELTLDTSYIWVVTGNLYMLVYPNMGEVRLPLLYTTGSCITSPEIFEEMRKPRGAVRRNCAIQLATLPLSTNFPKPPKLSGYHVHTLRRLYTEAVLQSYQSEVMREYLLKFKQKMHLYTTYTAQDYLSYMLYELSTHCGQEIQLTQYQLADLLSMSLESFMGAYTKLKEKGFIRVVRGKTIISNLDVLSQYIQAIQPKQKISNQFSLELLKHPDLLHPLLQRGND